MSLPDDAPCPRLCHLIKWPDFDGYGFNLHAEKSKQGQYIGKVDTDSPAMLAGLLEGDKIIEVNFVNICNENHRQVVERIKSITNETLLLVIDDYGDRWYRERKMIIKSSQPNVKCYRTPVPRPPPGTTPQLSSPDSFHIRSNNNSKTTMDQSPKSNQPNNNNNESLNRRTSSSLSNGGQSIGTGSVISANSSSNITDSPVSNHSLSNKSNVLSDEQTVMTNATVTIQNDQPTQLMKTTTAEANNKINGTSNNINNITTSTTTNITNNSTITTNTNGGTPTSTMSTSSASSIDSGDGRSAGSGLELNLNMTAAQMRQLIAQRKKKDIKQINIDLKKKYEIIQQM